MTEEKIRVGNVRRKRPDIIDERQRRAAALLLIGFDLPAPMSEVARALNNATMADRKLAFDPPRWLEYHRHDCLTQARDLINTVLADLAEEERKRFEEQRVHPATEQQAGEEASQ